MLLLIVVVNGEHLNMQQTITKENSLVKAFYLNNLNSQSLLASSFPGDTCWAILLVGQYAQNY